MNNESLKPNETHLPEEFETDSQKIVRRHLENENDVITDEDIRSVRIGITSSQKENPEQKLEELIDAIDSEKKTDEDSDVKVADDPITPWDTVQR